MPKLTQQSLEACRDNSPKVSESEQQILLSQLEGWQVVNQKGLPQLVKIYHFDNFVNAMAFTVKIGELAEQVGHHPALLTEWGSVTVSWWTHIIDGLHKNDFIMAARTDMLK
jgi:4a-hydroxytetrahydrobiopterin dehydratase